MTTIEVKGFDELKKILRELPFQVRGSLIKQALRRAAKPMKDEAVNLAPERKGGKATTKKAITIKNETRADEPMILIAPTKGKTAKYDAWYSRFHEFGTGGFGRRTRKTVGRELKLDLKKGRLRNYSIRKTAGYKRQGAGLPAIRFMQRAYEGKKDEVLGNINKELSTVVTRYLRKNAPKYYAD